MSTGSLGTCRLSRQISGGYFKEPAATVKIKPQGMTKRYANGRTNCNTWCNANCPDEYKGMGLNRAAIRAITPPGFANAFYKANK